MQIELRTSFGEGEVNIMSKWSEIRINFFDEEEKKWSVDAWETDDDNEEGSVIALPLPLFRALHPLPV